MPIVLEGLEDLTREAVAHDWKTLLDQGTKQRLGEADKGGRAAVTGGKQMAGFCRVVKKLLEDNGLKGSHIYLERKLELPGYFRPTKNWDMLAPGDRPHAHCVSMDVQCARSRHCRWHALPGCMSRGRGPVVGLVPRPTTGYRLVCLRQKDA